jgi:hypothetical protein
MLWHCMLLCHNTWHSACWVMACDSKCLLLQHTMIRCIVCCWVITSDKCLLWYIMSLWHSYCLLLWHTISYDVTYVCRPYENIMFQSFIILSFMFILSYFEFSLNVLFWVILELYSVKQNTESVQFVDFKTPHCHVTLPKDLYSKKDMNLGRFNIDCM